MFDTHYHYHNDNTEIIKLLKTIIMSNERIEAALGRMGTAVEGIAASQTNIAEDIRRIKEDLTNGADVEEIATRLETQASQLEQSAANLRALDLENEPAPPADGEEPQP